MYHEASHALDDGGLDAVKIVLFVHGGGRRNSQELNSFPSPAHGPTGVKITYSGTLYGAAL